MLSLFMQQMYIPNVSIYSNTYIYPNSKRIISQKESNYLHNAYKTHSRDVMKQSRDICIRMNEETNKIMKLYAMNKQPIYSIILTEKSFESHQLAKKEEKMIVEWIAGVSFGIFALSAYFFQF